MKNSWVKVPSGMHLAHRLHVSLLARLSCSFTESRGSNSACAAPGDCREVVSCWLILVMRMD